MGDAEHANFARVADIVRSDPALAARIISVANDLGTRRSANPPRRGHAGSGDDVRGHADCGLLSQLDAKIFRGLDWGAFWRYQMTCACASRHLSELTKLAAPGTCFAAGLLSNIGGWPCASSRAGPLSTW